MSKNRVRIVPLGGLGEIGKNMMAIECGNQILVIDSGLMFPSEDMLGVDLVIPDISYLVENKDKIQGIIITHGHEDHTGALPFILARLDYPPLHATRLTNGLISVKLKEHRQLEMSRLNTIRSGEPFTLGDFQIEPFQVSHSIPDGIGLGIKTPAGLIVHTGDFKFDHTPVDGRPTDFALLADFGSRDVLLLMSDSTNADQPGYTPSERTVGEMLDYTFSRAEGRVIVATFASNISRVQQVIDAAEHNGRRVAIAGRSMVENVRIATELGYLVVPEGVLIRLDEVNRYPARQVALITTGSQGEPTSALSKMAAGEFKAVQITPGDTVIVSARPIPGNEESVNHTIDNLFRQGANVLYHKVRDVHVSGHASQEEQKLMLNLVRPRYFIPIHGEYRHLVLHGRLAADVGVPEDNIFVMESGETLELDRQGAHRGSPVPAGYVYVDGLGVGDVGDVVLRDRGHLARDGVVLVTAMVDRHSGHALTEPDIISRGFVYEKEAEDLLEQARQQVAKALAQNVSPNADWNVVNARIKDALSEFLWAKTHRRPMILPVVMEV